MNTDAQLIYEAYKPRGFTGVKTDENGAKVWYVDGKRHRVDGPAVELADGSKAWWVNDKLIKKEGPMHTALKDLGIDL